MSKVCNICFKEKELAEFYANKGCADGYQNRCKECTKQKSKERLDAINSNPDLKEKERERHRQKYHRLNYKDKHKPSPEKRKTSMGAYKKSFPEKTIAHNAINNLRKTPVGFNFHHWSYNTEHVKDVIELSVKDHAKAHRFIKYDQERFMYRRIDTMELLDTREAHEAYIFDVIANKPN